MAAFVFPLGVLSSPFAVVDQTPDQCKGWPS
jgi:hypothetical protein